MIAASYTDAVGAKWEKTLHNNSDLKSSGPDAMSTCSFTSNHQSTAENFFFLRLQHCVNTTANKDCVTTVPAAASHKAALSFRHWQVLSY